MNDGVQVRPLFVVGVNSVEVQLHQLNRRQFTGLHGRMQLVDGGFAELFGFK